LRCVRSLPDGLRTDKRLWRELVRAHAPDIPFASRTAVRSLQEFVSDTRVLELLLAEIKSANAAALFVPPLRAKIAANIHAVLRGAPSRRDLRLQLARTMPASVREAARTWFGHGPKLHPMVFAFRAFVASRMTSMLKQDADSLASPVARAVNL
jgi:hypothetical protein